MIVVTLIGHVLACFAKLFILPHLSRTLRVKTVHYGQIVQPPIFHSSSAFLPSVVQWVEILSEVFSHLNKKVLGHYFRVDSVSRLFCLGSLQGNGTPICVCPICPELSAAPDSL